MSPFFSIIVPAYNVGGYIENTVRSIVRQDFTDYELILTDDGSSDDTASVCRRFSEEFGNILFVSCAHRGVSAARNEGLKRSSGKYILFVDGDDYIADGALGYIHGILSRGSPDILCFGFIRTESMSASCDGDFAENFEVLRPSDAIARTLTEKAIPCCTSAIKSSLIKENGITFDEDLCYVEDALFLFRVLKAAKSVWRSGRVLYFYLQRQGSATHRGKLPSGVFAVELKAWKRIGKLVGSAPEMRRAVNRRLRSIRKSYCKVKIKEWLSI